MFTGLVAAMGTALAVRKYGQEMNLVVDLEALPGTLRLGDSIALSGVCCTVTGLEGAKAAFVLSAETLRRSWFDSLAAGHRLNLEPALRLGDALGGHWVQGHVDGVGEVLNTIGPHAGGELWIKVPGELRRYLVEKGSLCVDGVSLTLADLRDDGACMAAVIPHTAQATTLGRAKVGDRVNLEVDILAKYVERMLQARNRS